MKVTIGVIVLVIIMVGTGAGIYYYSASIYNDIRESLDTLEKAAQDENWDVADKEKNKLQETWNTGDMIWSAVMDHGQVDRVDESITRIIALINQQSRDDLLVEITLAKRLVNRLQESESPRLRSIF